MVTLVNRAKMGTATTGTGTITLGSAETGYQSFADAGVTDGQVVRYVIEDGTDWEIGSGTYTASGTTMSRTVSESSNADAALNLTGSAVVYVSATAEDIPPVLELYAENPSSPTAPSATGTNAVAIGFSSLASGFGAFSAGYDSTASGSDSVSLGSGNIASGVHGFAVGGGTATAAGARSISIGYASDAASNDSTAVGRTAQARAVNSNAFGYNSYTITGSAATAIGQAYASGTDSFAAAIANNTSSYGATQTSAIAIGSLAKASQSYTFAVGRLAQATGGFSYALGQGAVASGAPSHVFGHNSSATQADAVAIGRNAVSNIRGKHAFGTSHPWTNGNAQAGLFVLLSDTTDATPEALTTNNSAAGTDDQIILPNNSAYSFSGTIIARQDAASGSDYAAWEIKGALLRDANAASTVLGNGIKNKLYASAGASAWDIALTADTTNGGLAITVTGAAATNIRWVATVNTSEVTY